ncbi:LIC13305 family lipoprotein [Leptospira borgpetersenii]|uniref:Lipoprotein n=1 Tax=Leptospira borgpetersenii serovar Ballum TaxID=280505 RepID=A0A0E3BR72_LEPBO|nr:hypothetical protein [Leptospira borgpetersenii]EMO10138.1 hypothetical protein LEP1GSC137_2226 [Leptospira borgpetersenii str. Noumea 25]ALO24795.1 hypothetical protein LBBP_00440 [Leptospira borgpetersenii serovar Ballum]ANG99876.1 Uncharacterized protein LB4E_0360 [Leptospira borgpetersenii str. 4E]EKR02055.1 hypothetical protein LEP1GSC121_0739 [Leptospira borgpetersenii serovar Castellonis str. 200801910]KGE25129.1 hypothetical protein IQ66_05500 [Leptospira borgpetersenii serovar Ball
MLHFIFYFLILISLIACNESKNKINSDLLLLLAISTPDRAENYDRDVQIITNLSTFTDSGKVEITCDLNYSSQQDIDYYVEQLKKEIARYPRGYWIKTGVDKIVLCKSMTTADGRIKLAFSDINLLAISVTQPMATMRYGTTTCGGIPNFNSFECYDQPAIHHELTHSVDRSLTPAINFLLYFDPEWEKLNAPGFQYYGSENFLQIPVVWHPLPGIMGRYGASHFVEDRAVFGALIMGWPATYNILVQACQTDPFVAAKVRLTVSRWKQFWPFPGAENTEWKIRMAQAERDCD